MTNLSSVSHSLVWPQRKTSPGWFHHHVLGELIHQGSQNKCPAAHTAQGASWKAGFKFSQHQWVAKVLIPCLSGLQRSVPWLPGDRADGFPFQEKQRAETRDVSWVSLIHCSITHVRHSQGAPQQDTHSKIRDLMGFLWKKGQHSGVALGQHHCNNATSSLCCPHISWAALGISFSCSLLITRLEAAASTSKRSKNYSVCTQNEHVGHGAFLPWTFPVPTLILPTTEEAHIKLLWWFCSANTTNAPVFFVECNV